MEGVSHEAASLAGTLALGKLIFLTTTTRSLDGPTSLSIQRTRWAFDVLPRGTSTRLRVERRLRRPRPRPASLDHRLTSRLRRKPQQQVAWRAAGRGASKIFGFPEESELVVPDAALATGASVDRGASLEAAWKKLSRLPGGQPERRAV